MEKSDTPGKFEIVKPIESGLWGKYVTQKKEMKNYIVFI